MEPFSSDVGLTMLIECPAAPTATFGQDESFVPYHGFLC